MAAEKQVSVLALELEKLEKSREGAIAQRDQNPIVTIKVVGSDDIILSNNQSHFFDGLIDNLNLTIDQTKKAIHDIMFPKVSPDGR